MRLDYWNHPLIVKAIRVKYRGNKLFVLASGYLMLLLVGMMVMFRYRDVLGGPNWVRNYFVAMISLQFVLSAIIASSAVSSSMQSEVATRTLDFQRIAAISPLQILLGKVIGEPASSYLLAMASIPVAVLCHALGGVSLSVVLLLYATLATTTFMIACVSVQHSLDPAAKGGMAVAGIGGMIFVVFQALAVPLGVGGGGFRELVRAAIGLLTPVLTIKEIAGGIFLKDMMPFFGARVPYALLTPLAQIAVAVFAVSCMVRRLTYPLATSASKPTSYLILASLDVVLAGFVFDTMDLTEGLAAPGIRFALGHMLLAMLLVGRVTPNRDSYLSWVWRLRGRRGAFMDLLAGERNLNVAALLVFCLIGVVIFVVAVAAPANVLHPDLVACTLWPALAAAATISLLVLLCYGTLYQGINLAGSGKGAGAGIFLLALVAMFAPWAIGEHFEWPAVSSLSPIAVFVRLFTEPQNPYPAAPFVIMHVALTAFWAWGVAGIVRRLTSQVDRKLESMGVDRAATLATR